MNDFSMILDWQEEDLMLLPDHEDDYHEYKSGAVSIKGLKEKLCKAASAFWNSGGGIFIVGVNDEGLVDGGIPLSIMKTDLRDWVDQVLQEMEPNYRCVKQLISPTIPESKIRPGHAVLIVAFPPSPLGAHMAPDKKYYIRAGNHSHPAGHFIVEAIRAKRVVQKPLLGALIRISERKANIAELVVMVINGVTALEVKVRPNPVPPIWADNYGEDFMISVPIISPKYPVVLEVGLFPMLTATLGTKPLMLDIEYEDEMGREYTQQLTLPTGASISPVQFTDPNVERLVSSIENLVEQIKRLTFSSGERPDANDD